MVREAGRVSAENIPGSTNRDPAATRFSILTGIMYNCAPQGIYSGVDVL